MSRFFSNVKGFYAAPTGANHVGFQSSKPGAVKTTVNSALDELDSSLTAALEGLDVNESVFPDLLNAGAAGDGVANDQLIIDAEISINQGSLIVNDGHKFLVNTLSNIKGVDLQGFGHIVKAITGGVQKLNSYADKHQYVFGREYLAAFHNLLITQYTTPTRKPIIVFSGDSTTAGVGVSEDYQINALLKQFAYDQGIQTAYGISSINRGQSGANTEQWRTSHLAGDLAESPDLLVLRWGINDPGWLKNGTTPPLDAGQAYPDRRDVDDFLLSLRSGLETIRASRSLSSLSIVLMSPNSTADTPNGRDELWYEQIIPGIKQAARDFQCAFVDTYAYLKDSRPAAGIWMDDPFGDGRAIHPLNVMNMWIAGLIADVIFPQGLVSKIGRANVRSVGGAEDVGDVSRLPSYYKYGVTISRAQTGFPIDGTLITVRSQDETVLQLLYPYKNADRSKMYFRAGASGVVSEGTETFGDWYFLGSTAPVAAATGNVTPSAGFTIPGTGQARAIKAGSQVICEGYITKTSPAIVAANTTIATLPVGFRPVAEAAYWNAVVWDGASAFAYVVMRAQPDGSIAFAQATPISMNRIWLNVNFSTLA